VFQSQGHYTFDAVEDGDTLRVAPFTGKTVVVESDPQIRRLLSLEVLNSMLRTTGTSAGPCRCR
jgi:hypothetical protein